MPSKGNRALVWKYFRKEGDKSVVCGVCGQRLAYRSSTSTMRYHLERKHPVHWGTDQDSNHEDSVPSALENVESSAMVTTENKVPIFSNKSSKLSAITYYITELVVRDLLPLREIQNSGMKQLLKYLEPSYTVPDRDTITSSIIRLYDEVKQSIQVMLEEITHLSLTADIWTSSNTQLYTTISANWISSEWRMKSCVLSTQPLSIGHSWDDLEAIITDILISYNISPVRVSAVVCPADVVLSGTAAFPVVRCFASTLSLAVQKGLEYPPVAKVILAARKLVSNIKHLSGSIVELALQQAEIKVSEIQIEQDISTQWYSTFTMLEQLRDQQSIICAVVGDTQMFKASDGLLGKSNTDEWELINCIIDTLKPLKTSTEVLSSVKNVSLSSVYPVLYGLVTVHLADSSEESHSGWTFRQIIRNEICAIWNMQTKTDLLQVTPVISSILDPRYHNLPYLTQEQQALASRTLTDELNAVEIINVKQSSSLVIASSKEVESVSPLDFLLGRHVLLDKDSAGTSSKESRESELKLYLDNVLNPPASTECDPLFWWQCNRQRFPHLELLAYKYLGIPASSIPVERLFSDVGLAHNCARVQIEQDFIDYILFLNRNLALVTNK